MSPSVGHPSPCPESYNFSCRFSQSGRQTETDNIFIQSEKGSPQFYSISKNFLTDLANQIIASRTYPIRKDLETISNHIWLHLGVQQSTCCTYRLSTYAFLGPQSTQQSAGPVRFLIFCSISISLLASLVAGRRPQCSAGADWQGMYSTIPIHWNIKSAPASSGRSRVGPAFYVFSFLAQGHPTSTVLLEYTLNTNCLHPYSQDTTFHLGVEYICTIMQNCLRQYSQINRLTSTSRAHTSVVQQNIHTCSWVRHLTSTSSVHTTNVYKPTVQVHILRFTILHIRIEMVNTPLYICTYSLRKKLTLAILHRQVECNIHKYYAVYIYIFGFKTVSKLWLHEPQRCNYIYLLHVNHGYMNLPCVSYGYMGLQCVDYGYMSLQCVSYGYMSLRSVSCDYRNLQCVSYGYRNLEYVSYGYMNHQCVSYGYLDLQCVNYGDMNLQCVSYDYMSLHWARYDYISPV